MIDFHRTTHHDSDVNKKPVNVLYEFLNNSFIQGFGIILLKCILDMIDTKVIILWALFYASMHNINYAFVQPITHKEHHIDPTTNYFMDIWDIIIGTKFDWSHIESHNHGIINLVVLTAGITLFEFYRQKQTIT